MASQKDNMKVLIVILEKLLLKREEEKYLITRPEGVSICNTKSIIK